MIQPRIMHFTLILACACVMVMGCQQQKASAPPETKAATKAATDAKPAGDPTATANNVVDSLTKGDFAAVTGLFDATMKSALPEPVLRQTMTGLAQQAGAFKSRSAGRVASEQGFTVVYVPCQFERAVLTAKVVMDGSGQVAGLFFQ